MVKLMIMFAYALLHFYVQNPFCEASNGVAVLV